MPKKIWSSSENLIALKLFAQLKQSGICVSAALLQVQQLAATINRSESAVVMRLGNYEYLYSEGIHGLKNGGTNLKYFYETNIHSL